MNPLRAIALLFVCAASTTATAHNLVRIRGELIADDKGLLVETTWTDDEIASFRIERDEWAGPTVGNLDEVTAVGAALADGFCLLHGPELGKQSDPRLPPTCTRSEFVKLTLIQDQHLVGGRVEVVRRWRMTHRIPLRERGQSGWFYFNASGPLTSHPLSIVLSGGDAVHAGLAEFTPANPTVPVTFYGTIRTWAGSGVVLNPRLLCGNASRLLYGEFPFPHTHRDLPD